MDVKDLHTFSVTMFRCAMSYNAMTRVMIISTFRLQLKVFALFHSPVLGPVLRLVANKLMRLNIFLATDWEQWILQVRCRQRLSDFYDILKHTVKSMIPCAFFHDLQNNIRRGNNTNGTFSLFLSCSIFTSPIRNNFTFASNMQSFMP